MILIIFILLMLYYIGKFIYDLGYSNGWQRELEYREKILNEEGKTNGKN